MTLSRGLFHIIPLLGWVIVSVYLHLRLNHLPFSLVLECSNAKHKILMKMIRSMIQK